ncbi:hypothetical protein [Pseudomonas eucalypticola]|uniref:Uncharacterized protein n=1 Tax=Pseudomonas eucalypticola TaxID=2599595 RepID=A0A7D5D548_9PSED|nr:hypothetical protein [Pseudomonas eucalypticola]QKZ02421.1 hypothetical protein HWQ56_00885 [Pseudomonas eucalypticola]
MVDADCYASDARRYQPTRDGHRVEKKRSAKAQRRNEERRVNQRIYWLSFYRRQYKAKLAGAAAMFVLMGSLSVYYHTIIPIALMTPILVISISLLTWLWRDKIGLVNQKPRE